MAKKRSESRSEVVLLVPELHEFSRWRNHCQSLYKLSLKLICCRSKTKGLPQESPKLEGPSAEVREVCRLFGEDRHLYSLSLVFFFFCGEQSKWKGMQIVIVQQAKSDSSRKKPIRHKSFTVKPTKNESGYWMRNSLYTKFYWATTCFNCHLYIFMHIMNHNGYPFKKRISICHLLRFYMYIVN